MPRRSRTTKPLPNPSLARSVLARAALLLVLTAAAYTPAINAEFIWDDDAYVENNATLRDLSGLREMWLNPYSLPQYYPLVHTTFWLEYQLTGLESITFHITNILLHIANAFLLWRVLHVLAIPGAWCAAMLFALHPVHVESVAWITERKNVLSGFFYFSAALSFLRFNAAFSETPSKDWRYFALTHVLFVAALLSKTVTATLPAALLVVAWWRRGRVTREDVIAVLPMFVLALPFALYTAWLEKHHVGAEGLDWDLSWAERLLVAGRACWFYLSKLLVPRRLAFIYPRWQIDASVAWQYLFPAAAIGLLAVLWVLRHRLGRGPLAATLFFGGTLFPALGFFNVFPMRYSYVADHFQYLASVGVLVLLAAGGVQWLARTKRESWRYVVAGLVFIALAIATWSQCWIYGNREVLWLDTIHKNPQAEIAYTNLGMYYLQSGRFSESLAPLQRSLELSPQDPVTRNNLGVVLGRLGQSQDAIAQFEESLRIDPNYPDAHSNLGAVLTDAGKLQDAEQHLREAIRLKSDVPEFHYNLGRALHAQGLEGQAEESFAKARALSGT